MFRRKQAPPAFVRACTVFLSTAHETAFVAALINHGGLFAEQPGGIAPWRRSDTAGLGAVVRAALDDCRYDPEFNYRDRKPTDWPAFQQSGCRSVREFQQTYVPLGVRGLNDANLLCAVESPSYGRFDLRLGATISFHASAADLGACVEYVWQKYRRAVAAELLPAADHAV